MKTLILNTGLIDELCVGMYYSLLDPNEVIDWEDDQDQDQFNFETYKKFIAEVFNYTLSDYGVMESQGIEIKFRAIADATIDSPREYNFYTDTIDFEVTYDPKQIKALVKQEYDRFDEFLYEHYSSRDGFLSLTPNNVIDWLIEFNKSNTQAVASFLNYWNHYHRGFFEEIQSIFIENVFDEVGSYDFFEEAVA